MKTVLFLFTIAATCFALPQLTAGDTQIPVTRPPPPPFDAAPTAGFDTGFFTSQAPPEQSFFPASQPVDFESAPTVDPNILPNETPTGLFPAPPITPTQPVEREVVGDFGFRDGVAV